MFETNQFKLPLLQASQAQKHVTVNEAISRLDAVAQLRLESITVTTPPVVAVDGQSYWIPDMALGSWSGNSGTIAIFNNGDWVFLPPKEGWAAWVVDEAVQRRFVGTEWQLVDSGGASGGGAITGPLGSSFNIDMIEFEHDISSGASNATIPEIPAGSMVAMVAFRVSENIVTDGATSWRLGISNSVTRYGSGYQLSVNSNDVGGENKTMFYYPSAKSLYLTPESGLFISGKVIFTIYLLKFGLPNAI